MRYPRLLLTAVSLGLLATALPSSAAQGDLSSIALRDFNRNGKIDRAIVTFANPSHAAWTVRGLSGLTVSYDGSPIALAGTALTASGDQMILTVGLDETDTRLIVDTSAAKFEVAYHRVGAAIGISDGVNELSEIAAGDTNAGDTELDQAPPILTASTPEPGTVDYLRTADITLTFSEPMLASSLAVSTSIGVGGWFLTPIGDGRTVTAQHDAYPRNANEVFGIAGNDLAGNALVTDAFPNPFAFQTSADNSPNTHVDPVFVLTSPAALGTLLSGDVNVLAWYTNQAAAKTRLSYSNDGGQAWNVIATVAAPQNTYLWYPTITSGTVQLKAEALDANNALVNVSVVSPLSVQPGTGSPALTFPSAPVSDANDKIAPQLVGPAVIDAFDAAAGTARITWTTDEPSTASVSYGVYLNYGSAASDAMLSTTHSLTLSGLKPGQMHQARIASTDVNGNPGVSKDYYFVFLREGDLIKGNAAAVYWYKGGKRSAFSNLDTYRSHFGDDFSKVIRVPDTQLGTIMLGANVKMKEGVYLIKIQSDPKTYAVEPGGVLRWIQTEAQAQALYGTAWAKRVRDVDVSLFSDYAIGAALQDGEKPAGYNG